jgi:hypothetical protein
LVRDPRNSGAAVVRVEDRDGGSEGYTFDLFWGGYNTTSQRGNGPGYQGQPGFPQQQPGYNRRYTADQAVRICQDAIRQEARSRFDSRGAEFVEGRIDDNPGRNDWIVGRVLLRGGTAPREEMRYSCSVDFDSGRVRSAAIDPMNGGYRNRGDSDRMYNPGANRAIETCQRAVEERVRRDGYGRAEFNGTRMDDNPGRNDRVVGNLRAFRGPNFESFDFSCSVDLRGGDVRSVDVRRR